MLGQGKATVSREDPDQFAAQHNSVWVFTDKNSSTVARVYLDDLETWDFHRVLQVQIKVLYQPVVNLS